MGKNKNKNKSQSSDAQAKNMNGKQEPVAEELFAEYAAAEGGDGASTKDEANKAQRRFSRRTLLWQIGIGILVIVALVLIFTIPSGDGTDRERDRDRDRDKDKPVELADGEVAAQAMVPYTDGEYNYSFEGIDWIFEDQGDGTTKVNFFFENFSRREGAFITFGRPYKMGTYQGVCSEADKLDYDEATEAGTPLSFVVCDARTLGLFQEDQNIVAKTRPTGTQDAFTPIYTIDMTEVIY